MDIYVVYGERKAEPGHFPKYDKLCFIADSEEQVDEHIKERKLDEFYVSIKHPMKLDSWMLYDLLLPQNITGKNIRIADVDIMFQEVENEN